MKTLTSIFILFILTGLFNACNEEKIEMPEALDHLKSTQYFDNEIFSEQDLKIYGTWKLFDISGGIHGNGYALNFDYLVIKKVGIYGFVKNDSLLEYGKIAPAAQIPPGPELLVEFEKDEQSDSFFTDTEKYVQFNGTDTLHLYSPCCDRYNYHLKRVK